MLLLVKTWLDLCLFRAVPQALPASGFFLRLSLGCYALVSWLVASPSFGVTDAVLLAIVDTGMLAGFVVMLLYLQSKTERINQALSALAGSGSLMGLFALPLVLLVDPGQPPDQVPALLAGVWLLLLIWNLFVMAHIIRHALSSSFAIGLGAAVLYALVSMQIVTTLFPQQAV
ncbi:MAG TPA: hypothetical protein DCO71_08680 [Gammaproteobacteria bacterium]|nr:hypothetical protein [Gammaproteobacteria bacterium]